MHESSSNEIFIKDFIEKIRFAHSQISIWRKSLDLNVHNTMNWKGVESQKKYMEELMVEIGWQAIQLYQAGEFEESSCGDNDESILSEEDVYDEENSIDEEKIYPHEGFLDHVDQDTDGTDEEFDVSESMISDEELLEFHKSLFSNSNIDKEMCTPQEKYTPMEMWTNCGVLLCVDSTKEERDLFFRTTGSAISKGFFDCWRKDASKRYDNIVRFFVSSLLYIQSFPRSERPQSALGDGAFNFLIDQIPANRKLRKKIERYQISEETEEVWINRMAMFWNRINEQFFNQKKSQSDVVFFNEETALNRLQSILETGSEKDIVHQLLYMVGKGMSSDPRLVRLLSNREDRFTLTKTPRFSALRRSLRANEKIETVEHQEKWESAIFFEGKDVIVIGGEKKRILLDHFTQIIPQANVRWVATSANSFVKRVKSLTKSVEQGSIDFVLVIQNFISHSAATPLFKAKNPHTHVEMIENGYGKREIKLALERCLRAKNPQ